jgi:hypothetical protein
MASSTSISSKLIAEVLTLGPAPVLKSLGFRKQGRHFFRHTEAVTCHLDVQADRWNEPSCTSFTVNLWSYLPAIAAANGESVIAEPLRQALHRHCGIRIGGLLPDRTDFWWRINSPEEVPQVATDLTSTIERYAIPYLNGVCTLWGVVEFSRYPTEPKAIALRLLGREKEASEVEGALRAQADEARQRVQAIRAKGAAEA